MGHPEKSPAPARNPLPFVFSALLLASLGACSCEGSGATQLAPRLVLEGLEQEGKHHFVDFGAVSVGSVATVDFRIRNTGSARLDTELVDLEAPFAATPAAKVQVDVGGSTPATFSFRPTEEGPFETVVRFTTNGAGTHSVTLRGSGKQPALVCNPNPVDFGRVAQGNRRSLGVTCFNEIPARVSFTLGEIGGKDRSSFGVSLASGDSEAVSLEAGESVDLDVTFYAIHLGNNQATLSLDDEGGKSMIRLPLTAQVVNSFIDFEPASCLDFGPVEVGSSRQLPLVLHNLGDEPTTIATLEAPAGEPFRVLTEPPLELEAGASVTVELEFAPTQTGNFRGDLVLRFSDERHGTVSTCLRGVGGGARLSCTPAEADFGAAAVGIPVTRSLLCTNAGTDTGEEAESRLFVDEITSTHPLFSGKVRNEDGSEGPRPEGYGVAEPFYLEIAYVPEAETLDEGLILVASNSVTGAQHEIPVSGIGRILPPCQFTLRPPALRFGNTQPGETATLDFSVINDLDTECIVSNVELDRDSHPAFHVDPIDSHLLAGGEELRVPVAFSPDDHVGRVQGRVNFTISNPDDMHQQVELVGASEEPCLVIEPAVLDFGAVDPGCSSREREVRVYNVCAQTLTLDQVELIPTASQAFRISQAPLLPKELRPGEQDILGVVYEPEIGGTDRGGILIGVQGREPYMASLEGEASPGAWQTDSFTQAAKPKVDVLFVMDNSGSFGVFQKRVADNLPAFLHFAQRNRVDYQIGVTTSGLTPSPSTSTPCPGGAEGGEDGRLFPIDGSSPRILTPLTPNLEAHWRNNMQVGECHSSELYLEAAKRALSPPAIDHADDPRYPEASNDGNLGFLRPDAALSIIFVADENDQSPAPVEEYLSFFLSIKGSRYPELFRAHAITSPRAGSGGHCNQYDGSRLIHLVEQSGGVFQSICQTNWEVALERMSQAAFGFAQRFQLSNYPAIGAGGPGDPEDIQVFVDGKLTPPRHAGKEVWSYDPLANTIDFSPMYVPDAGSLIEVRYRASCIGG